jgi:hypothetical protein
MTYEKKVLLVTMARLGDFATDTSRIIKEGKVMLDAPDDLLRDSKDMIANWVSRASSLVGFRPDELYGEAKIFDPKRDAMEGEN